jgi:predicted acetyltransferase
MDQVSLTCDKSNIGSVKTMMKNGAVWENEVQENGKTVQRYCITI